MIHHVFRARAACSAAQGGSRSPAAPAPPLAHGAGSGRRLGAGSGRRLRAGRAPGQPRAEPPAGSPHKQPTGPPPTRHVTLFTPAAARRRRARPHSFELRNTGPGGPPRAPAAAPPAGRTRTLGHPKRSPCRTAAAPAGGTAPSPRHRGGQPLPGENKGGTPRLFRLFSWFEGAPRGPAHPVSFNPAVREAGGSARPVREGAQ